MMKMIERKKVCFIHETFNATKDIFLQQLVLGYLESKLACRAINHHLIIIVAGC